MNKKELLVVSMIVIIFVSLVVVGSIGMHKDQEQSKSFCQDNGFESYEQGVFRIDNDICIKVEDGYRVEKEFGRCGEVYCFIRNDDALVSEEEQDGR